MNEKFKNGYEVDFEEKLIADSIKDLKSKFVDCVYCFSEHQAKEIVKRAKVKCKVKMIEKNLYQIKASK